MGCYVEFEGWSWEKCTFLGLSSSFPFKVKLTDQTNKKTLVGDNRISSPPPFPGLYPSLGGLDPFNGRRLGFVAFRNTGMRGPEGAFYDYTARYGEEDGRTLTDSLSSGVLDVSLNDVRYWGTDVRVGECHLRISTSTALTLSSTTTICSLLCEVCTHPSSRIRLRRS